MKTVRDLFQASFLLTFLPSGLLRIFFYKIKSNRTLKKWEKVKNAKTNWMWQLGLNYDDA